MWLKVLLFFCVQCLGVLVTVAEFMVYNEPAFPHAIVDIILTTLMIQRFLSGILWALYQSLSQETWCMCGWLSILLIQQDLCISKQRHSELQCHCWHGCLNYEFIRIFWIHAPGTKKSSFATKHFFFSAHCTCCKNYYTDLSLVQLFTIYLSSYIIYTY